MSDLTTLLMEGNQDFGRFEEYDFSLLDSISEEDLSDVEGDALEDYGFNETGKALESRFENELS